jgi:hypothetical protein
MVKNYFNLDTKNFYYEDKGDLRRMVEALGKGVIKLKSDEDSEKPPF